MASDSMIKCRSFKSVTGFSLIELMITVAILAIIAAIAIPAYTNQITRTNRTEGHVMLNQTALALERCFTRFNRYDHNDCTVAFDVNSENDWYRLPDDQQTVEAANFTLVAVPQGAQATRDAAPSGCGNLTLTHTGARGWSGNQALERCW